jgi:hypothetical protein
VCCGSACTGTLHVPLVAEFAGLLLRCFNAVTMAGVYAAWFSLRALARWQDVCELHLSVARGAPLPFAVLTARLWWIGCPDFSGVCLVRIFGSCLQPAAAAAAAAGPRLPRRCRAATSTQLTTRMSATATWCCGEARKGLQRVTTANGSCSNIE